MRKEKGGTWSTANASAMMVIMGGTQPMMVDCCQYSGYDGISCLVHWLQWWIVAGTQAMMEYCAWYIAYDGGLLPYCSHDWVTWLIQKATKSYSSGTIANRGLWTIKIIWYQVYSGSVDGTSAIGYSLFVLRLWQAMGGI